VKPSTIIRTVILALALVNNCLSMAGHSPLPIEDAQIEATLSGLFTIAAAVWSWWKNNSFTQAAITADEIMADMKASD
jgi:SPP1 family holin